jgi:hypothetical protein
MYYIVKSDQVDKIKEIYSIEHNVRFSIDKKLCIIHSKDVFTFYSYENKFPTNTSILNFIHHPDRIDNWEQEFE